MPRWSVRACCHASLLSFLSVASCEDGVGVGAGDAVGAQDASTGDVLTVESSTKDAETASVDGQADGPREASGVDAPIDVSLTDNLVPNPELSPDDTGRAPASWSADSWGTLTATHGYFRSEGSDALRVEIRGRQDGDAKWLFDAVPLEGNRFYDYSALYRSDGRTRLVWSCRDADRTRYHVGSQAHRAEGWSTASMRFYVSEPCVSTVMQILDRDGWLDMRAPRLVAVSHRPLSRAYVSVTFDDVYASAVAMGAKELESRGLRGSYYVTRDLVSGQTGYATPASLTALSASGHEIGAHGATHRALSTLDTATMRDDVVQGGAYLKGLGLTVDGLAYPYGDFDDVVDTEARRAYAYARTSLFGLNDGTADRYRLAIFPVTADTTDAELFAMVAAAMRTSTWLIVLFHDLASPQAGDAYRTSPEQYARFLDELVRTSVTVLPVRDVLSAESFPR